MTMDRYTSALHKFAVAAALAFGCFMTVTTAATPGAPVGSEFRANTHTAGDQGFPATAMDPNGNYVIIWDSIGQDGSLDGIYGQRYAADGTAQGSEFRVNQFTANRQGLPAVTMLANGNFVVVWESDDQDINGFSVYARIYGADGTALTDEFKVNDSSYFPTPGVSVASDANSNFVVGWGERNRGAGVGLDIRQIRARIYSSDGTPKLGSIVVQNGFNQVLRAPSVAMAGNGNWVMTWVKDNVSIYARRYKPTAKAQGGAFRVDTADASIPAIDRQDVAMDGTGDFTVVWEGFHADLSSAGIHAQRYNASGTAQGSEFTVGSGGQLQFNPAIAMDSAGNFVVAAHGDGIYAQRYAANGSAVGGEFHVNSSTTHNTQLFAAVGMQSTGNFVIAWQNFQQDGDGRGVYAQRYAGP